VAAPPVCRDVLAEPGKSVSVTSAERHPAWTHGWRRQRDRHERRCWVH